MFSVNWKKIVPLRAILLASLALAGLAAQNGTPSRKAREAFEEGQKAALSNRTADARRSYEQAVTLDAGYADAWFALGKLQAGQNELDAARKSFEAAIRAESSRTDFYFELAKLEQGAKNWKGLIDVSGRLLKLNASDYPEAYLLSANGYYGAGNLDAAEERARAGEKLDTRQQYPKLHELLGWILVKRSNAASGEQQLRQYAAAVEEFHQYLKAAPPTAHTEEVRATLDQIAGLLPGGAALREPERPATAANAGSPLVLRSTTSLVQVDVIAKDGQGRAVEDLKKDDFEVFDNGKPRQIATFVVEKFPRTAPAAAPAPRPAAPPNTFTNRIASADSPRGGYSVILMDWFNTGIGNTQRARLDALKALKRMDPGDKVALYSLDRNGLRIVNEFGSSAADIVKSLGSLSGTASPCRAMQLTEMALQLDSKGNLISPETLCDDPKIPPQQAAFFLEQRIRETLNALQNIADRLRGAPGRKSLIWISSGVPSFVSETPDAAWLFPDAQIMAKTYGSEFERIFRRLNNAGVSVYPVDARGLPVSRIADDPRFPGSAMIQFTTPIMDEFASRTGGVAYYGRNNLDEGIEQAFDDSRVTYLLGYYAPEDDSRAGFHKIGVKARRDGVKLRYREGYSVEPRAAAPQDRIAQLTKASLAPVDATTIPIDVTADRKQNALTLRVTVNPADLGLVRNGDRWQGRIDVGTLFVAGKAEETSALQFEPIDLDLSEERYEAAARDGLVFPKSLEIPAGADRVKVLVRNGSSGEIGSLTIPGVDHGNRDALAGGGGEARGDLGA